MAQPNPQSILHSSAELIIVKIGSATLTHEGKPRHTWLNALADDVATLREEGKKILIVSSGAIALGRLALGIDFNTSSKDIPLPTKQGAAAIGQGRLYQAYEGVFKDRDLKTAQILITRAECQNATAVDNARSTLGTLLEYGVIPVINENDTTATEEIRFGDNDRLAAYISELVHADTLIILSTTDGLYTADPKKDQNAEHIPFIAEVQPFLHLADDVENGISTGGMKSKLEAAGIAAQSGTDVIIASGAEQNCLKSLFSGAAKGTVIPRSQTPCLSFGEPRFTV
jgi:glutamate 5-kinase